MRTSKNVVENPEARSVVVKEKVDVIDCRPLANGTFDSNTIRITMPSIEARIWGRTIQERQQQQAPLKPSYALVLGKLSS